MSDRNRVSERLDARYKWLFPVKDVHGRDATFAIGLDDGHVIVSIAGLGWCSIEPEMAEKIGYDFTTAAYATREQRRRKNPPMILTEEDQNSRNSSDSMPRRAS